MAGTLFGIPLSQRVDANGEPAVGWRLYIYQANTSTPVNSYQDTGLTVLNTWPLQADASGMMGIFWLADGSYRARGTSNDGSIVYYDIPNIVAIGPSTGAPPPSGVDPNAIFRTGDLIWLDQSGVRSGWVRDNGNTIGSATSGATEPGGNVAAAQPLFEFLWNTFSDAICPVSSGRGGSSLADWTANKKIGLPDKRGGIAGGVDGAGNTVAGRWPGVPIIFGDTVTAGSVLGEVAHTLVQGELANHAHIAIINDPTHTHAGSTTTATTLGGGAGLQSGAGAAVVTGTVTIAAAATGVRVWDGVTLDRTGGFPVGTSDQPHNNVQKTVLGTFYRKL